MNKNEPANKGMKVLLPILFGFFVMGFVDVVGIASNYVKADFGLTDKTANLLPMMVFLWFALFSIPTGILMGKIGRRNTVVISFVITALAMLMPLAFYDFNFILVAFALLGIGNTILQVSLNPMIAHVVHPGKTSSVLTLGQFIKAICSFLGPIIAARAASGWGDWKWIFVVYAITTVLSTIWLVAAIPVDKKQDDAVPATFGTTLSLLKDKYIVFCFLGILAIVGVDVGLNTTLPKLLQERIGIDLDEAGPLGASTYFAARTAGAFIGSLLLAKFSPLRLLQGSMLIVIVSFLGLIFAPDKWMILSMIVVIGFFCASVFSIIFSFALGHKSDRSNEVSALMIMGVSGGAVFTPLMGIASDSFGMQAAGLAVLLGCVVYIAVISFVALNPKK